MTYRSSTVSVPRPIARLWSSPRLYLCSGTSIRKPHGLSAGIRSSGGGGTLCSGLAGGGAGARPPPPPLLFPRGENRDLPVELARLALERRERRRAVLAGGDPLPARDLRVPLQHLEARPDLVDGIAERLELGRLVDHELGGGHLAAVVQPAGDVERFPPVLGQREVAER